jgi:hypothetical protein
MSGKETCNNPGLYCILLKDKSLALVPRWVETGAVVLSCMCVAWIREAYMQSKHFLQITGLTVMATLYFLSSILFMLPVANPVY